MAERVSVRIPTPLRGHVGDARVSRFDRSQMRPVGGRELGARPLPRLVRSLLDEGTALAVGAEPLHEPRLWPEYHPGYYGAFVRDPDGNNVEAVFHDR